MPVKNEIRIKTKYKSIEECRDYCRDIPRKTVMATTFSRGISGEVDHDGLFELSSTQKDSAMFMLTIPWLNLIYSYRSNALYGEIIKKVGI